MTLTPLGYFDLIETFPNSGCAVCNLLKRDMHNLLDSLLYEYVVDPDMHDTFRAARGLCNEHSWQLAEMGNVMGIGILYQAVLDEVLKVMRQNPFGGNTQNSLSRRLFSQSSNGALADALEPKQACYACESQNDYEARYLGVLVDQLTTDKMQTAFRDSEGLCLEHFKQALGYAQDKTRSQLLVEIQREIWEGLYTELSDFVRKYEFKYADQQMGAEGDSWLRTVARMSGEKGIFGMRRK